MGSLLKSAGRDFTSVGECFAFFGQSLGETAGILRNPPKSAICHPPGPEVLYFSTKAMNKIFLLLTVVAAVVTGCNSPNMTGANSAAPMHPLPTNNPPPTPVTAPPNSAPVP